MSTQDATEIPFSASHSRQAFKLLELPPEVVALLECADPPTLYLKSSRPTATGTTQALLTTPSKTYRIQQKNSSNPIMMLLPSDASLSYLQNEAIPAQQAGATDNMDLDAQIGSACALPRPSVCMVATIEDTLELIENDEATVVKPVKVNKWHEKFAKSRETSK